MTGPRTRWEESLSDADIDRYAQRFIDGYESGADFYGEARFVDVLANRESTVLDAGCGTGRLSGALTKAGHRAIGVDKERRLLDVARRYFPETTFVEADLYTLRAEDLGVDQFDLVAVAGNVLPYLAAGTERTVLGNLADLLRPGGRIVMGFGTNRGYDIPSLERDLLAVGMVETARFADWHLGNWHDDSEWIVLVAEKEG